MLLILEVYLRIATPQNLRHDPKGAYVPFGNFHRLKPNFKSEYINPESKTTWVINSQGLRSKEIPYNKPNRTFRIVGLGDSFTFGFAVGQEETLLNRLEELLNSNIKTGKAISRFETVNMGVGGYGTVAQLYMLQKEGLRYQPDMIVLAIFVGNDVYDSLKEKNLVNANSTLRNIRTNSNILNRIKKYFGSESHLYSFISVRFHKLLPEFCTMNN